MCLFKSHYQRNIHDRELLNVCTKYLNLNFHLNSYHFGGSMSKIKIRWQSLVRWQGDDTDRSGTYISICRSYQLTFNHKVKRINQILLYYAIWLICWEWGRSYTLQESLLSEIVIFLKKSQVYRSRCPADEKPIQCESDYVHSHLKLNQLFMFCRVTINILVCLLSRQLNYRAFFFSSSVLSIGIQSAIQLRQHFSSSAAGKPTGC